MGLKIKHTLGRQLNVNMEEKNFFFRFSVQRSKMVAFSVWVKKTLKKKFPNKIAVKILPISVQDGKSLKASGRIFLNRFSFSDYHPEFFQKIFIHGK